LKLGERSQDVEWLRRTLGMASITIAEKQAILDRQVIRPIQEWSNNRGEEKAAPKSDKERILGSLDTNVKQKNKYHGATLLSTNDLEKVPSIEISSPNTSEMRSRGNAHWLAQREPSYVR
jgi:hypothetical protein